MRFNAPDDLFPADGEIAVYESPDESAYSSESATCDPVAFKGRGRGSKVSGASLSEPGAALNAALRLLTRREYSLWELRQKLLKRYSQESVEAALKRCVEEGWQSEARTAEMLLRHVLFEGYGPKKLLLELQKRRLDRSLLDSLDKPDWAGAAQGALRRRYGSKAAALSDSAERQKALAYLFRRGFVSSQCVAALTAFREELGTHTEES